MVKVTLSVGLADQARGWPIELLKMRIAPKIQRLPHGSWYGLATLVG